jgi:hypothetical protein
VSSDKQVRLVATPLPEGIVWEIRDDERRLGHGTECPHDWVAVRAVEVRAGIAITELRGAYVDDMAREFARQFGWEVKP